MPMTKNQIESHGLKLDEYKEINGAAHFLEHIVSVLETNILI